MIIGLIEHDRGKMNELSLQMLTLGRRLAAQSNTALEGILIGAEARPLAEQLGAYGVFTVHLVQHERLNDYALEAWGRCMAQLTSALNPEVIMAAGSERGNEVMAHAAAIMRRPMAANCVDVQPGDPFVVTRQRWGGSLLEEAQIKGAVKLVTVAPHAVQAEPSPAGGAVRLNVVAAELSDKDLRVRVTGRVEAGGGHTSLANARVVVGGGRGVGSADGFKDLEELAALLDGAVGGSRVVTSLGWRPHADQVGQTGTRIAPDLYIACGISGAIQHMVGCKAAKHILAINTDRDAPIVTKADSAIIGDLHQIIPALSAEIKKARK